MKRNLLSVVCLFLLAFCPVSFCSAQTYCSSSDDCSFDDYIQSFSTTGGTTNITNNNTGCTGGYTFYSTMIHSGVPGGTVNFSFTNTPEWNEYYKIWVDWNTDGDFDDAGEQMYASASSIAYGATVTGSFLIPAAATSGNKRFRIRCGYADAALTPCDLSAIGDGETEDYILYVGSSTCSGTPTAGNVSAGSTSITCNTTTTLSLVGNTIGTGITYQWQYNTTGTWVNFGTSANTQTTPNVVQATQFRCNVTCTNAGGGTSATAPVTVNVIPPALNIGNDTSICPGVTYSLSAGYTNATYLWSTGATVENITVNAANVYSVKVTLPSGCKAADTIVITPGVVPVNNLAATTNLCSGDTAHLNAGNAASSYVWTPGGATTQSINTQTNGNYSVVIKSVDGCKITSNTNVITRPLPVANLGNDTSICDGATIVLDAGNPGYAYNWSNGAATQTVNASDSGVYSVTVTTPYGCHVSDAEHISYLPSPRVEGFNFIPQFYNAMGEVQFSPLNPTNVMAYKWNFGDNSPESTQENPIHTFAAGGFYNITVQVFNGCGQFEQSQTINVDLPTGTVTLTAQDVHVAIFPNPANDYLMIKNYSPDIRMQQVSIFNVVGALVYQQAAASPQQHKISVGNFANGIYSIRILTDKGYIVRKVEVLR